MTEAVVPKTSLARHGELGMLYTGGRIQMTPDGEALFCPCHDEVKVVDVASGQVARTLQGDTEPVLVVAVSPDGQLLVVSSRSQTTRVYDWQTGVIKRSFKPHEGPVSALDIEQSSTLLATGASDSSIKVWDLLKGFCTHNFRGSQGVVSQLRFHPSKLMLFSSAEIDCNIRMWDLETSRAVGVLEGHVSSIRGLAFGSGGMMFSCGRDKVIHCWDVEARKLAKTIPLFEALEGLLILPTSEHADLDTADTDVLVAGGDKGVLRLVGYPSGDCLGEQEGGMVSRAITGLAPTSNPATFMATYFDNMIGFYSYNGLRAGRNLVGHNDEIIDLKFIGGRSTHVAVATNSDTLQVLELATFNSTTLPGHTDVILSLDVSCNGRFLATSSKDGTIRIWMLETDEGSEGQGMTFDCVAIGSGHADAVGAVCFARKDNSFVVSGSKDTTVKLWPLAVLEEEESEEDEDGAAVQLKAKFTRKAHDKDINSMCVAPNDKLFATGSQDRTAKVWRRTDGVHLGTLRGHKRAIWCTQFSPVDQVLASSSGDMTIRLWSLSDYSCLKTLEGHTNSVLKFCFVTRGTQILSSGSDGLIKLWDVKANDDVATFDGHDEKVWALAVSPDEQLAVSGGADSKLVVWRDDTLEQADRHLKAKEHEVLLSQELANRLRTKDYAGALRVALSLRQPHKSLGIFKELLRAKGGAASLGQLLQALSLEELRTVLEYTAVWNKNSRHCHVAHQVLGVVLRSRPYDELGEVPDIREMVQALLPYTDRHLQRMNRLLQQTHFVDYMWQAMRLPDSRGVLRPPRHATNADGDRMAGVQHAQPRPPKEQRTKKRKAQAQAQAQAGAESEAAPTAAGSANGEEKAGEVVAAPKRRRKAGKRRSTAAAAP